MLQEMDTIVLTDNRELKKSSKGFLARKKTLCFVGVFFLAIIVVASLCLGLLLPHETHDNENENIGQCELPDQTDLCHDFSCNITMIESIPENLTYTKDAPSHPSIYSGWLQLLDTAQSTIYIASSYWSLRSEDVTVKDPSSWQGDAIFNKLIEVGKRGDYLYNRQILCQLL
jgi:phospholipase D3/4